MTYEPLSKEYSDDRSHPDRDCSRPDRRAVRLPQTARRLGTTPPEAHPVPSARARPAEGPAVRPGARRPAGRPLHPHRRGRAGPDGGAGRVGQWEVEVPVPAVRRPDRRPQGFPADRPARRPGPRAARLLRVADRERGLGPRQTAPLPGARAAARSPSTPSPTPPAACRDPATCAGSRPGWTASAAT